MYNHIKTKSKRRWSRSYNDLEMVRPHSKNIERLMEYQNCDHSRKLDVFKYSVKESYEYLLDEYSCCKDVIQIQTSMRYLGDYSQVMFTMFINYQDLLVFEWCWLLEAKYFEWLKLNTPRNTCLFQQALLFSYKKWCKKHVICLSDV